MTDARLSSAAAALSALGHEARLRVFRLLVRAGPDGLAVGEIARREGLAPSTLAHHLGALVDAGLVTQEKRGREVVNHAVFARMNETLAFVAEECCAGLAPALEEIEETA